MYIVYSKRYLFSVYPYVDDKCKYHLHIDWKQLRLVIAEVFNIMEKRSGPKIEPCETPQVIKHSSEKTPSRKTKANCLKGST